MPSLLVIIIFVYLTADKLCSQHSTNNTSAMQGVTYNSHHAGQHYIQKC